MNIIFIGKTNNLGGFDIYHEFSWNAIEDFGEIIKHSPVRISDTEAESIEKMDGLSIRSKILFSAVAGAAIQYLIDNDIPFTGDWEISVEKEV